MPDYAPLVRRLPAIDGYEVVRELGQGGMGAVYLVRELALDRPAALKVMLGTATDEARERFDREARAGALLEHPALVPTYDTGETASGPFFTMRLVEGRTLGDEMASRERSVRELVSSLARAARGVAYAHARGLVHRDLKPANVMVSDQGECVVLDWGLVAPGVGSSSAEWRADADAAPSAPSTSRTSASLMTARAGAERLTLDGALMGTPAYMSPEQADGRGAEAGPPCDVYALGAILYEILVGSPAVSGSLVAMLEQVREGRILRPSAAAPKRRRVPAALDHVCTRAMHLDPGARYPDAGAFADDLEAWLEDREVSVMPLPWATRAVRVAGRHPRLLVGATLAVALATVSWAVVSDQRLRAREREADRLDLIARALRVELEHADDARREAGALHEAVVRDYAAWRSIVDDESLRVHAPDLPPREPNERLDRFLGRTMSVAGSFDWPTHRRLNQAATAADSPPPSALAYAELQHHRGAWRRAAETARRHFERALRHTAGGDPPAAAAAGLAELGGAELDTALDLALAWEHDRASSTTYATAGLTAGWRDWLVAGTAEPTWPEALPIAWRDVIRAYATWRTARAIAGANGSAHASDDVGRRGERVLDGRTPIDIAPLPAGVVARLYRATGESLWARARAGGGLDDDPWAGLALVAEVGAEGGRFPLLPGEHLLWMQRGPQVVRHLFLVDRDRPARIDPIVPRAFPPDAIYVPRAEVSTAGTLMDHVVTGRWVCGPFFIARTEVSLRAYREFLDAEFAPGVTPPPHFVPMNRGQPLVAPDAAGAWQLDARGHPHVTDDMPAIGISYAAAASYACWRAVQDGVAWRLPTNLEWLLAAGGPAGRNYPWGDEPDPGRIPGLENDPGPAELEPSERLVGVDTYPAGRSPYGVCFMLGNAWEWLATPIEARFIAVAGGDNGSRIIDLNTGRRNRTGPLETYVRGGIRLVCDAREAGR